MLKKMALFKKIKNTKEFNKDEVISEIALMLSESYPQWHVLKIEGCDFCLLQKVEVQEEIRINQYKNIVPKLYLDSIVVDVLSPNDECKESSLTWALKHVIVDSCKSLFRVLKEHK